MSAFSRGCLPRHRFGLNLYQSSHPSRPPRFLSGSCILRAANNPKVVMPKTQVRPPRTSSSTVKATGKDPVRVYRSFAEALARKSQPTSLYEAPSHTMFISTSYSAAALFLGFCGCSFYIYQSAPQTVAQWVPLVFVLTGFLAGAGAGYLIIGPSLLVKSIRAVPKTFAQSLGGAGKGGSAPELQLEVELRKRSPLPFFPARRIYFQPQDMMLPVPLATVTRAISTDRSTPAEKRAKKLEAELARQKELDYERSHLLTSPFRHASKAFYALFQNTRRVFIREGFMDVRVKGRVYKLDVTGGKALEDGRALDRLIGVKPLG